MDDIMINIDIVKEQGGRGGGRKGGYMVSNLPY
jgi:hypothetical protein